MGRRKDRNPCKEGTTATRNKKQFKVPGEISKMPTAAAKCRNPEWRKDFRKKDRKARREFDVRAGAHPKGKTIQRPVVKKLRINRKVSEDREEWMEEVKAHCKRCYDDKDENEVRIQEQRHRGGSLEALTGRKVDITVDRFSGLVRR